MAQHTTDLDFFGKVFDEVVLVAFFRILEENLLDRYVVALVVRLEHFPVRTAPNTFPPREIVHLDAHSKVHIERNFHARPTV